ncbi:hypothetical protein PENSUB_5474 [Penicillium subrubescens]|uniref:Uncharacterized protein n=1 Tax=Penicillium subrubescens TaxID=1316194 RepID=A0A1Q5UQX2_9EURO|nr:hypothetical protein PENSUB_5474 [Penicillium subrubescens]
MYHPDRVQARQRVHMWRKQEINQTLGISAKNYQEQWRGLSEATWAGPQCNAPIREAYLNQASDVTQPTFLAMLGYARPVEPIALYSLRPSPFPGWI